MNKNKVGLGEMMIYVSLLIGVCCFLGDSYLYFKYASTSILFVNFSDGDKILFLVISSLLVLMGIILLGGILICHKGNINSTYINKWITWYNKKGIWRRDV